MYYRLILSNLPRNLRRDFPVEYVGICSRLGMSKNPLAFGKTPSNLQNYAQIFNEAMSVQS